MIRSLSVSVVLIGVGVLIGILLPKSDTYTKKPQIEFVGYEGRNIFGVLGNRLRLEFRESMVVETIDINKGNCHFNSLDTEGWIDGKPIEFPISIAMGTVIDVMTDCDLFVRLSIQTDKGLFTKEFPTN